VTNLTRDPKGYYVALGIEEAADADAIKTAYRTKAKRLHPDFNPSPVAAKQFHRLHEAYETLSDPLKRKAYDQPWKNAQKTDSKKSDAESTFRKNTTAERTTSAKGEKSESSPQTEPKAKSKSRPEPKTNAASAPDQPAVCKCGRVTAQPRYITFDLVWGRLTRVQRRSISGIFCRSCADRTAIRASFVTWLAGWWAWPDGPKETVKALLSNMRGGRKPPERNARLLIRQSRAFRARGEMELARNAAEQALTFASTPTLRRDVDNLLLSLSAHSSRTLKDRWAKPGWAATAQVLPLALVVAVASMIATVNAPVPLTDMVKNVFVREGGEIPSTRAAPEQRLSENVIGRVLSVVGENASLRTGPGSNYQLVAILTKGTVVLATESDPGGVWLRVVDTDGTAGFMNIDQLSVDIRAEPIEALGAIGDGPDHSNTDAP
jgi:curved DNA-binding protein CbpA